MLPFHSKGCWLMYDEFWKISTGAIVFMNHGSQCIKHVVK